MSERDKAWKAYQEWDGITGEQLKLVRDDLAHAFDVLHRLEPQGGITTGYVRKKLDDVESIIRLRNRGK